MKTDLVPARIRASLSLYQQMSDKACKPDFTELFEYNSKATASGKYNQNYICCFSWAWSSNKIMRDTPIIPN